MRYALMCAAAGLFIASQAVGAELPKEGKSDVTLYGDSQRNHVFQDPYRDYL